MIFKILGAGILLAFTSFVLSELGFRGKRTVSVLGLILILSSVGEGIGGLLESVLGLCDTAGITDAAECAAKIVGAGYLFGICSDIASELGEPLVSKGLLTAGRVEMLLIATPYFVGVIKLGTELIK